MNAQKSLHNTVNYLIAAVWIINGLFCKIANLVPRHQQIVARILGNENAAVFTKLIGLAEVGIAVWLLSGVHRRINVILQIITVAAMNMLEFFLAADLLLWGKMNAVFAFLFIVILYTNEFYLSKTKYQRV